MALWKQSKPGTMMQFEFAADAQVYGEPSVDPSPETDQWDVEEERTAATEMEQYGTQQESPKDSHAFEISRAVDALENSAIT